MKFQASIRCLAPFGRFLEIGKYDLAKDTHIGMGVLLKSVSFHGILLDALCSDSPSLEKNQKLRELMMHGLKTGVVKPIPHRVFERDQVSNADFSQQYQKNIETFSVRRGISFND